MLDQLKNRAGALKREVLAVYIAARDPRTPWYAKALIFLIVTYAISPVDLIPDFVPVLGYLDDLIIVPGGIWLVIRLIPQGVMEEARAAAATSGVDRSVGTPLRAVGAVIIITVWILIASSIVYLIWF